MDHIYSIEILIALTIGLLATGIVAGILAGLLGVGGGIVIVPVLFILFGFLDVPDAVSMHLAVGTSLATIIPTSISSARSHHKKGALDRGILMAWGPFIFVGAAVGGILSKTFDAGTLTGIFGVVALIVSVNMVLPRQIILAEAPPEKPMPRGLLGTAIGGFSALMGIGGGTLSVPVLTMMSVPVHRAVGTASAFGLVIAVPAVIGFMWSGWGVDARPPYSFGYVNIPAAVVIFSASVFAAPFGSRIAHRLNAAHLKRAFAVFLFISAARMLSSIF